MLLTNLRKGMVKINEMGGNIISQCFCGLSQKYCVPLKLCICSQNFWDGNNMKTVENANVNTKFRGNIVLLQENAIFFAKNLSNFKSFQTCLPNLYKCLFFFFFFT